jgi:hypothetical protein
MSEKGHERRFKRKPRTSASPLIPDIIAARRFPPPWPSPPSQLSEIKLVRQKHWVPLHGGGIAGLLMQRTEQHAGELLFMAHCGEKQTCSVQMQPREPVHITGFPHQL